jgi:hypothetical protein
MKKTLVIAVLGSLAIFAAACSSSGVNNNNNTNANKSTVVAPATDHTHEPGTAPHNDNRAATKPSPDHRDAPGTAPHNDNKVKKP